MLALPFCASTIITSLLQSSSQALFTSRISNKALCDIGNGGGHEHMAGGFISYDKLERKDAAGIREIIKNRFMSEVNKVNK
jgi:hypothetical protein